ncbi:hypothetical protein [Burkholderia diffusa]|uniref:hypothetical protein n=1 Tax=Burkholderia diffusa TaxID=488732 RepID=UPI000757910A|nr:hypothetical protein [Burkholderia diffusa]KVG33878.1 hypothetical protein WJ30_07355 [Burkholderia diffusa]
MAIAFVAAAQVSATSSITVAPPAGWAAGQFALLSAVVRNGSSSGGVFTNAITPPTGWTTIHKGDAMWVGYRFLQSGDVNWTVSASGSTTVLSDMATFTGVDATNPVDVSAFAHMRAQGMQGYGGGFSPPVNPTHSDDYLVLCCGGGYSSGGAPTAPSGYTSHGTATGGSSVFIGLFGKQATSAATQAGVSALTSVMASGYSVFSGIVALKTSGSATVAAAAAFPYLAASVNTFYGAVTTSTNITADFNDLASPNDLLFVHISGTGTTVINAPDATWTAINLVAGVYSWYRTARSGDPSTFNFTAAASTTVNVHTQVVKTNAAQTWPVFDKAAFNSAAASTTTPSTPALTSAGSNELLLTRIANNSGTSSTMTYHPTGSNVEDLISFAAPNESLGHLVNSPSPSPTAYCTKSAAATNTDVAAAILVGLARTTPQVQQMILS